MDEAVHALATAALADGGRRKTASEPTDERTSSPGVGLRVQVGASGGVHRL